MRRFYYDIHMPGDLQNSCVRIEYVNGYPERSYCSREEWESAMDIDFEEYCDVQQGGIFKSSEDLIPFSKNSEPDLTLKY